MLDSLQSFQMANRVLRHCSFPFVYASENWFGGEAEDLIQFFADDPDYFCVRGCQNLLIARSTQKTADKCSAFRSAMRKLIMDERRSHQALALTTRHQEAGARGQLRAHILIIGQAHSH